MRVVVPLPLLACRVVKSEQQGLLNAEPRARQPELLDTQRTKVVDWTHGRVRFAGFTVGGTGERHAHPTFTEVREDAAVEDLVVRMGQYDQE
jgi:hypothetical protein